MVRGAEWRDTQGSIGGWEERGRGGRDESRDAAGRSAAVMDGLDRGPRESVCQDLAIANVLGVFCGCW